MELGLGKSVITPHKAALLAGFAARREVSGVHDELYARAFAFREGPGQMPTVIIQLDILMVDSLYIDAMQTELAALGIDRGHFIVFCIHTHSAQGGVIDVSKGPKSMAKNVRGGDTDQALLDALVQNSVAAVRQAIGQYEAVTARAARGAITGLATNRHAPEMPSDQSVFLLEFTLAGGKKALLYNLCCHPTVMNGENTLVSADWPGAVNAALQGEYELVCFINGSCGDMSTRFTRRESTFAEVERFGGIVTQTLRGLLAEARPFALDTVGLAAHDIPLQEAAVDTVADAERKVADAKAAYEAKKAETNDTATVRKAYSFVEGANMNLYRAQSMKDHTPGAFAVPVELLRLGGVTAVCSPFELYSVLALRLKARYAVEMFGYTNSVLGYMADAASYDMADYEALSSNFEKGQGEAYIEKLAALLEKEGVPHA